MVLETAKLTEGKIYKLTIDGVADHRNRLRLSFEFRATEGERDTRPRLDYIYAIDKYVVAAVFDKPVRYTESETILVLKPEKVRLEPFMLEH